MQVSIECKCGDCIQTKEICPNKYYPFQSADDFCLIARVKKDICDYCLSYKNNQCTNYFFCDMAEEAKDYCKGLITTDNLSVGTRNMLIEMSKISL